MEMNTRNESVSELRARNKQLTYAALLGAILAVCLLAVGGIAVAALNKKNQEIEIGKSDLTKANEKIVAMSNDLGAAKSEAEMATKDLADLKEKMTNQAEDLAAFASLAVVCAIELNDKSHDREDRKSRDGFLNKVCKDVGLPIVWMKAQNNYNLIEIRQSIRTSIEGAMHATKENPIYNPKEFRKPRT